jgi:hypothetical protein
MRNLSQKEQAVLDCIRSLCKENGFSPSVRDICVAMGYKSTSTVQMYLDRLAEYGYIRRADGKSRSLFLCEIERSKPIKCLRRGALPTRDMQNADFEGTLAFAYTGELPEKCEPIAVFFEGEWWVIAVGEQAFENKPTVCVENRRLTLSDPNDEMDAVGVLLAKLLLY